MNPGKQWLLNTYLLATTPVRAVASHYRHLRGTEPVQILFYHRVADYSPNPWTISSEAFAQQIEWLQQRFDIVSLAEAQRRILSGKNSRPTVAITFDDGYADNCDFALPLLLDRELPFTYFVTSKNVANDLPFPHDVERGEPLPPNSVADIQALSDAGIEIGAHTRTHVDLATIEPRRLDDEINGSKHDLEEMTGRAVRYFAFPFGQRVNMTPESFELARDGGFAGVCSAYGGYNFPGRDPFHLKRIHADPHLARFAHWLSVDVMKSLASSSEVAYVSPSHDAIRRRLAVAKGS